MYVTACAYFPPWMAAQAEAAGLIPRGIPVDTRRDWHPISPRTALIVVEAQELLVDRIFDSWFASISEDPGPFVQTSEDELRGCDAMRLQQLRYVLVRLPNMLVPTQVREKYSVIPRGIALEWHRPAQIVEAVLSHRSDVELAEMPTHYEAEGYVLHFIGRPMPIDRSPEAAQKAQLAL